MKLIMWFMLQIYAFFSLQFTLHVMTIKSTYYVIAVFNIEYGYLYSV
jgi:hypothetical protein